MASCASSQPVLRSGQSIYLRSRTSDMETHDAHDVATIQRSKIRQSMDCLLYLDHVRSEADIEPNLSCPGRTAQ